MSKEGHRNQYKEIGQYRDYKKRNMLISIICTHTKDDFNVILFSMHRIIRK